MPVSIFGTTSNTSSKVTQKVPSIYLNTNQFLKHDGSVSVTAPLNMSGNTINNLPFPSNRADAANRDYVDTKIDNLDDELRQYIDKRVYEIVDVMFENTIQLIPQ